MQVLRCWGVCVCGYGVRVCECVTRRKRVKLRGYYVMLLLLSVRTRRTVSLVGLVIRILTYDDNFNLMQWHEI